jgi:hypothetical protein
MAAGDDPAALLHLCAADLPMCKSGSVKIQIAKSYAKMDENSILCTVCVVASVLAQTRTFRAEIF